MRLLRDILQDIKSCEDMMLAARLSADNFYNLCVVDSTLIPNDLHITPRHIRDCREDLELTYLIRLFAVFEQSVRAYWEDALKRQTHPMVGELLNCVASRCHMQVAVLDNAHAVREFRNHLVHGSPAAPVTFSEARKYLCIYLSNLVGRW